MVNPINTDPGAPGPDASMDEIQEDIERTRQRLGETVDELSDRLDVKRRAKAKISTSKPPASLAAAAASVGFALAAIYVWRRR